jgi:hypothetical protein
MPAVTFSPGAGPAIVAETFSLLFIRALLLFQVSKPAPGQFERLPESVPYLAGVATVGAGISMGTMATPRGFTKLPCPRARMT